MTFRSFLHQTLVVLQSFLWKSIFVLTPFHWWCSSCVTPILLTKRLSSFSPYLSGSCSLRLSRVASWGDIFPLSLSSPAAPCPTFPSVAVYTVRVGQDVTPAGRDEQGETPPQLSVWNRIMEHDRPLNPQRFGLILYGKERQQVWDRTGDIWDTTHRYGLRW